jgi:hypothetical protein
MADEHDPVVRGMLALIEEIRRDEERYERERTAALQAVETAAESIRRLAEERDHVEHSLASYRHRCGVEANASPPAEELDVSTTGTLREALVALARRHGGHLVGKDAVRLLQQAGRFKTPENADSAVYTVLSRTEDFEKLEPGVYRLVHDDTMPATNLKRPRAARPRLAAPRGMLRNQIAALLEGEPQPVHYRAILGKLRERGIEVPGFDPVGNVRSALSKDPRFQNVGHGLWRLKPPGSASPEVEPTTLEEQWRRDDEARSSIFGAFRTIAPATPPPDAGQVDSTDDPKETFRFFGPRLDMIQD